MYELVYWDGATFPIPILLWSDFAALDAFYVQTFGTSTMIKTRIICQISIQICQTSK